MTITLTPEQLKWLEAQVAAGHFASVEEAVRTAITDFMAAASEETGEDLEHLRREVDADIAAGRVHYYANADELTADIVRRGELRSKAKS